MSGSFECDEVRRAWPEKPESWRISMRDGTRLFTVLYSPKDVAVGRRYPLLLVRTPFSVAPYKAQSMPHTLAPDPFMLRDGAVAEEAE